MPSAPQDLQVTAESIASASRIWRTNHQALNWNCLFALPLWLDAWLSCIGDRVESRIFAVRQKGRLLGLAPLQINGARAGFIGSADLCDYLDFVVAAGSETQFYSALLTYLHGQGIDRLALGPLREDSSAFCDLTGIARKTGWAVTCIKDELSFEMTLPASWDDYLTGLKSKQRHEVRRKLRRLSASADFNLRTVKLPGALGEQFDCFLDLFRQSRAEKTEFLTRQRLMFLRLLTEKMAAAGMLRLYILDIGDVPAATALCFDYADTLHLYNSGYDRRFAALSAGQVCTLLTIKAGIANGRKVYNFLKGDEAYKSRLGGRPVQLVRCELIRR